jgi:RNA polymerase sigma factor (sigma-70 family)
VPKFEIDESDDALNSFLARLVDEAESEGRLGTWSIDEWWPLRDFEQFHAEHRRRLISFVGMILRARRISTIDAEDVVQDAFEVVFRKWDSVGRMDHPDKYLRRVAANRAQRLMDKASREVANPMEPGFLELTEWALGWERSPQEMLTADALQQLLKSLPQRQAQVLLLTADGWSDSQIGELLHLSPATVRSHRRHLQKSCRRKVKQELDAWSELLRPVR